jgi:nitroreductase
MDIQDAILRRQSNGNVRQSPVPRELVEKILTAAVQAPNHYKVRPWRFVVLAGAGRERLGEVMADSIKTRLSDLSPEALAKAMEKERSKPLRAPLLIAVGVDTPLEPKVLEIENICAAAAACENLLLAAQGLGLAAKWRTGETVLDPRVKEFLGFSHDQHLIAFLYIGFPESEIEPPQRHSYEDRTIWME